MKFTEQQTKRLADIGVVDTTRGHGKRFVDALSVMTESACRDAESGNGAREDSNVARDFDSLWSTTVDKCIAEQTAAMQRDGFNKVEGWYAFLDRELSAFGVEQTGGPIAGALWAVCR